MESSKITKFCEVTGATEDIAAQFLSRAHGDVDGAVAAFLESGESGVGSGGGMSTTPSEKAPRGRSERGGPHTIQDLLDGNDDDDVQGYYAGGGEKGGGELIQDPREVESKRSKDDLVSKLFESAKSHGAEEVAGTSDGRDSGPKFFSGPAYRLGSTKTEPVVALVAENEHKEEPEEAVVTLTFYKNGFTVDDGELRDYESPQNTRFLGEIQRGVIPRELVQKIGFRKVAINMHDRKGEDWSPPKKPVYTAYSGDGMVLGSGAVASAPIQSAATPIGGAPAGQPSLKVDETKPTTNLQIRMRDGTRLVLRANLTLTVSDLYAFVATSGGDDFVLQTTFPRKELRDRSLTIEAAGLQNAVIVQR